jgi:hypothetical protein
MTSLQAAVFVSFNAAIALLMIVSGLEKRRLSWKAGRRCPRCGLSGRHDCSGRR